LQKLDEDIGILFRLWQHLEAYGVLSRFQLCNWLTDILRLAISRAVESPYSEKLVVELQQVRLGHRLPIHLERDITHLRAFFSGMFGGSPPMLRVCTQIARMLHTIPSTWRGANYCEAVLTSSGIYVEEQLPRILATSVDAP
jgi:hypothetical protein